MLGFCRPGLDHRASRIELTKEQTVDWNNGKAVIGENESEILKLVKASQQ
jgi:hypothetical protein